MKSFIEKIFSLQGLKNTDLTSDVKRFSKLLPYKAADFGVGCTNSYLLKDGSACFIYECVPLILADDSIYNSLTNALKLPFPEDTVIQISLYSDNKINDIVESYKALRAYSDELFKQQALKFGEFFKRGLDGLEQIGNNPVRNFRLFITVKIPVKNTSNGHEAWIEEVSGYKKDYLENFESIITAMKLSPKIVDPDNLVTTLTEILNPKREKREYKFDKHQTIDRQVIFADTDISINKNNIKLGNRYAACITPKKLPAEINYNFGNNLTGLISLEGDKSSDDDINQIKAHYLYTLCIIKQNLKANLSAKAMQVSMIKTKSTDIDKSFISGLLKRKEEFRWMNEQLENGEQFYRMIPMLWIFHENKEILDKIVNAQMTNWQNSKILKLDTQREQNYLLPKLFISALPGGLYGKDIERTQRDWIQTSSVCSRFAALNGGNKGNGQCYMLFLDRRGQLAGFDFFHTAENRNFLVTGSSGGGKSFITNTIVSSYLSAGMKLRIIDVGGSYEKAAYMFDGTYIDMAKEKLVINFFETLKLPHLDTNFFNEEEQEEVEGTLDMLTGIISTMVYSRSDEAADEYDKVLIELAIKECYKQKRQQTIIDDVHLFLDNLTDHYKLKDKEKFDYRKYEKSIQKAHFLAESIEKFTTYGEYGRYFNGVTNVDLTNRFVVIELNNLPEDLKKVAVLAFSSIISDEIYRGDQKPSIIALDEAWQTLSENKAAVTFTEGLSRKIRKHNGGIGVITQSLFDLSSAGALKYLGSVLLTQSAFHFILPDDKFKSCADEGLIEITEFNKLFYYDKLVGTKDVMFRFSEFLVRSKDRYSAYRLVVDPYTYLINSSDANDRRFLTILANKYISSGQDKKTAMLSAVKEAEGIIIQSGGVGNFQKLVAAELAKLD